MVEWDNLIEIILAFKIEKRLKDFERKIIMSDFF